MKFRGHSPFCPAPETWLLAESAVGSLDHAAFKLELAGRAPQVPFWLAPGDLEPAGEPGSSKVLPFNLAGDRQRRQPFRFVGHAFPCVHGSDVAESGMFQNPGLVGMVVQAGLGRGPGRCREAPQGAGRRARLGPRGGAPGTRGGWPGNGSWGGLSVQAPGHGGVLDIPGGNPGEDGRSWARADLARVGTLGRTLVRSIV